MNAPETSNSEIRQRLGERVRDMLYLSESEATLELLPPDPALRSQADVAARIGGAPPCDADAFLQSIRDSLDPGDAGLAAYLQQWEDLFALLKSLSSDICVCRHGSDPVWIDIVTIINGEALIIRTEAVET